MKSITISYEVKKTIATAIDEGKDIDEILQKLSDEYEDLSKEQLQELKEYIEVLQQEAYKEKGVEIAKEAQPATAPIRQKTQERITSNVDRIQQTEVEKILDEKYDEFIGANYLEASNDWYSRDACLDKLMDRIEYNKDVTVMEENKLEMISMYALEEISLQYETGKELTMRR